LGHYIRVLGTKDRNVPLKQFNDAFIAKKIPISISTDGRKSDPWGEIALSHTDGTPICQIERNPVTVGDLGAKEIEEFLDEMDNAKPQTAAMWLREFFGRVHVIYTIQIFSGAGKSFGWDAIDVVRNVIWKHVGGIMQADFEGFSNEDGYHILWQFSDRAKGSWSMAVLDKQHRWQKFQMDLGNPEHRRAFLAGIVPAGVKWTLA